MLTVHVRVNYRNAIEKEQTSAMDVVIMLFALAVACHTKSGAVSGACLLLALVGLSHAATPDGTCEAISDFHINRSTGVITGVVTITRDPVSDPLSIPYVSIDPTYVINPSTKDDLTTGDSFSLSPYDLWSVLEPETRKPAADRMEALTYQDLLHTTNDAQSARVASNSLLYAGGVVVDGNAVAGKQMNCVRFSVETTLSKLSSYSKRVDSPLYGILQPPVIDMYNPTSFQITAAHIFSDPALYKDETYYQKYITFGSGDNTDPIQSWDAKLEYTNNANQSAVWDPSPIGDAVDPTEVMTFVVRAEDPALRFALGLAISGFKICRVSRSVLEKQQLVNLSWRPCSDAPRPVHVYEVWESFGYTKPCARQGCIVPGRSPKSGPKSINHRNKGFESLIDANARNHSIRAGDGIQLVPSVILATLGTLRGDEMYAVEATVVRTALSADPHWLRMFDRSPIAGERRLLQTAVTRESDIAVVQTTTTTAAFSSNDCPHPRFNDAGTFLGCTDSRASLSSSGFIVLWVFLSVTFAVLFIWLCWCLLVETKSDDWLNGRERPAPVRGTGPDAREERTYEFVPPRDH